MCPEDCRRLLGHNERICALGSDSGQISSFRNIYPFLTMCTILLDCQFSLKSLFYAFIKIFLLLLFTFANNLASGLMFNKPVSFF